MKTVVKICGVRTVAAGIAAAEAGADMIGLVFVSRSPRFIAPQDAYELVAEVKRARFDAGAEPPQFVGLYVDPGERLLSETAGFVSWFQLHGAEDPERVAELRAEFGMQTVKAVGIGGPEDVAAAAGFADAADLLIFDAPPPRNADRAGGHGRPFDRSVLRDYRGETPFLIAGGLTPETVGAAIEDLAGAPAFAGVDVSSGVESEPGRKDLRRIAAFVAAARAAFESAGRQDGPSRSMS